MYKFLIASVSVIGLIASTSFTQQLPVQAQQKPNACVDTTPAAKRVILNLQAEKKLVEGGKVIFQPIAGKSSVKPGDILRYTLVAKNNSRCPVQNLMLKQPIPRGTTYVKNSATVLNGAELLFSIDGGKTYVAKPIVNKKEAPANTYTNLRWKFTGLLATNAQVKTTYELQVK